MDVADAPGVPGAAVTASADKAAYDDLPDGLLVADAAGRVTVLNPAAERLLGRTADEALGRDWREVLPLRDEDERDWWACTDPYGGLRSRTRQPERDLVLTDGPEAGRHLLVTARYARTPDGTLDRLIVALRDTNARARQERSRADLVSTVAHELRSPLTSVKGFTATLLAKWDRFNDEQKKLMLTTVNADADRVTRLLSELLDVSRIDAGRLEMRKQVVDVEALVRKAFAGRVASGEAEERFRLLVTGELPEVWADPDKLEQVIGNLVENGVRHGAGTVTVTVGPRTDRPGVELIVDDEGSGIPADRVTRVFTKFWRGGNRRGGTGLGLYIVKGLVEAHSGTVEALTSPAGGARFRILLPAGSPSYVE